MPASKGMPETSDGKRSWKTRRAASFFTALLTPAARAHGFAEASILHDWQTVVGARLAERCQPIKLSYPRGRSRPGVLELRASGGVALEIQHAAPQLVERINGYFGYAAVAQLRLLQMPMARRDEVVVARAAPLDPSIDKALQEAVGDIAQQRLREALLALGRRVARAHF